MWEIVIIVGLVIGMLVLFFWPRPDEYVRRTTKSYNSRRFGCEKDLY